MRADSWAAGRLPLLGDGALGPESRAGRRRSLAAPSGGENSACLPPESFLSRSRPFPAHQAGETGPTVCGYMGLDGASGSTAETQKLNFEEQPDSRVRAHGTRSDSGSHPCPCLGEEGSFTPTPPPQKPRDG